MKLKHAKMAELLLATNLLGLKYHVLRYYAYEYFYVEFNYPHPIHDLILILAYNGYTLLLLFIVVSSVTHKIPHGKHIRFFNVMGIVLYSCATFSLISTTSSFTDVAGVIMALLLILILALDATDQF